MRNGFEHFDERLDKLENPDYLNQPSMPTPPPNPLEAKTGLASDFQVGQKITVSSTNDISNDKFFLASEILIHYK